MNKSSASPSTTYPFRTVITVVLGLIMESMRVFFIFCFALHHLLSWIMWKLVYVFYALAVVVLILWCLKVPVEQVDLFLARLQARGRQQFA